MNSLLDQLTAGRKRAPAAKYLFFLVLWRRVEPELFGPFRTQQERKNALDELVYAGQVSADNDLILAVDSDSPHLAVGAY